MWQGKTAGLREAARVAAAGREGPRIGSESMRGFESIDELPSPHGNSSIPCFSVDRFDRERVHRACRGRLGVADVDFVTEGRHAAEFLVGEDVGLLAGGKLEGAEVLVDFDDLPADELDAELGGAAELPLHGYLRTCQVGKT